MSLIFFLKSAWVNVDCLRRFFGAPPHCPASTRQPKGMENYPPRCCEREAIFRLLEAMELVELTRPILARASQPLPVELGTLDAIHLATAMLWRETAGPDLVMTTHDAALGLAARASGLRVVGV